MLPLHVDKVLSVTLLYALEVVENGLALSNAGVSVHGEVNRGSRGLPHGLSLGETKSAIALTLSPRKVSHVCRVAVFITTHNLKPRIGQSNCFGRVRSLK